MFLFCSRKRSNEREVLPSLQSEKLNSTPTISERMNNPMFGDKNRSPTASAMGGLPIDVKSRLPSPKVHPAPQPPSWPQNASCSRVKKLSWGDDKVRRFLISSSHFISVYLFLLIAD